MASTMSWEEARDHLKKIRDDNARSSDEVVEIWECILSDFTHKLGNDLWLVYEQVCIAAFDCGRTDIGAECIHALDHQFPDSKRVQRLKGLFYEASEHYDKAEELYKSIVEEDSTNATAKKRLIAIYKAQNKIGDAIKALNNYLKSFMSDYEAWLELSDLYLAEQDYPKAAFCVEELIMSAPHNHLYYQRFAEIKYTQGGPECMEYARKYFAKAVQLNPNNMRALYGLFMASSSLASMKNKSKSDNIKFAAWSAQQISEQYKEKQKETSQMKIVEGLIDTLQITSS